MVAEFKDWISSQFKQIDQGLLLVVLFLIGLGLVQVYSSSFIFAIESYGDGHHFFRKQLLFSVMAVFILLTCILTPWSYLRKLGQVLWVLAIVGVVLTFIPSFAVKVGGAHRWVQLPFGFRFEPGELLKFSYPFIVAWWFVRFKAMPNRLNLIATTAILFTPLLFLLKQPDFGSFAIITAMIVLTLFIAGLSLGYFAGLIAIVLPAFYFLVVNVPYRWARVQAFLDPWSDPQDKGFQIIQSMLSFYTGGITGKGLGQAQGKLFFLPEAHTDFTLSIFAEEVGFIGVILLILLYGFLIFKALRIAAREKQQEVQFIAFGLSVVLGLSIFINMGVAMGLLPTKGLTLPFISYGGSSLVCVSFACGVLLAIDKRQKFFSKWYQI